MSAATTTSCAERRRTPRQLSRRPCLVRLEDFTGTPACRGDVIDISPEGVGLVLPLRLPPGARVTVVPLGWELPPALNAVVVRCEPCGDAWLHGGEFVRGLAEEYVRLWQPWPAV